MTIYINKSVVHETAISDYSNNRSNVSMTIYTHKHHIIPKHMGGTDDPSNLIELTIEEHAQAHLDLYNKHGYMQDLVAHRMLLGQIDKAEAIKLLQKAPKSERWKQTMSERMTGASNPMYGKTISDEQKRAIGESAKKRFTGVPKNYTVNNNVMFGSDNPKSRKVIVDGIVFDTVTSAAKAHGVSGVTARRRLKVDTFPNWQYA